VNAPVSSTIPISACPVPTHTPSASADSATFVIAVDRLEHRPALTRKVRRNLQGAICKCAEAISPLGLQAQVDIGAIEEWVDRMSPAQFGFKHPGSFSAFRSNLWRALKLTGHPVPLARYAPVDLSEPWAILQGEIESPRMRTNLRRFMHFASQRDVPPAEITEAHVLEFRSDLAQTCGKTKAIQTLGNTVRTWNRAVEMIPGWPATRLDGGVRHDWDYGLPWSAFAPSYRDDVDAFITHFDFDSLGPIPGGGLRARTKANYREGLRRAASILVAVGVDGNSIASLRDVVEPSRVKRIIKFLWDRNGEKRGGHAGFMAFLLLMVARDHVRARADVGQLERLFWKTADTRFGKMADRTWQRLRSFDDPTVINEFKNLHDRLVDGVLDRPADISTAKTLRLALSLALSVETALPPGNVVALDLVRDVVPSENLDEVRVKLPGDKRNRQPGFEWSLTPATKRIWRLYVEKYRAIHLKRTARLGHNKRSTMICETSAIDTWALT
jgi:hypothetical protein